MTRDHFKKVMYSPHFTSSSYQESKGGKFESKVYRLLNLKVQFGHIVQLVRKKCFGGRRTNS